LNAPTRISLAYSTDSDDAFMFWALEPGAGRIDCRGYVFEHHRADTHSLNQAALAGRYDVNAISIATYPRVADRYRLLSHGGSIGAGYGPVVVAKRPMSLEELRDVRVAIPGEGTTAYLVLRLAAGDLQTEVVPITPFERIFEALESGAVEAGLLIHEGRLTYERRGLHRILDVGEWWQSTTGLPLPLGGNVIRRALGEAVIAEVSSVLRDSIAHALEHREEALDVLVAASAGGGLDRAGLSRYLDMYANQDTLDYGETGRRAVAELFARAAGAGLLGGQPPLDWA
jgi:1,4-dihydroxy-6-naphthoate synthase